ncbi:uncharacterized protein LOC131686969 [Topomyia yanbarensis]|uniref:uncharacterized protein LOC131686969 n=1 Tax=Topomyia yanbarensis TaxID=2498891 RepID=UPI00273BA0B8|nr:uncharacterized protein LOC131686969 [Topomyia yanbarensis]
MVQCDGCDKWFHFVCVQVTEDIANVSWICPCCKTAFVPPAAATSRMPEQHHQYQSLSVSRAPSADSKSKVGSAQSETRRLRELELRRLEEEFEIEKRFLERRYEVLKEYGSEASSVAEIDERDNASKIEDWLAETERVGEAEDSGLAAEEANEQIPNISDKLEEHQALDVIQQIRNPPTNYTNQRDTRTQVCLQMQLAQQQLQVGESFAFPLAPDAQQHHGRMHQLRLTSTRSGPLAHLQPDSRTTAMPPSIPEAFQQSTRGLPEFAQMNMHSRPPIPAGYNAQHASHYSSRDRPPTHPRPLFIPSTNSGIRTEDKIVTRSAPLAQLQPDIRPTIVPPVISEAYLHQQIRKPPALEFAQMNIQATPSSPADLAGGFLHRASHYLPQDRPQNSRPAFISSTNHGLQTGHDTFVPTQRSTPIRVDHLQRGEAATIPDETVCVLNRSQIAARQAVPRDLPEFDGSLEDWPLFYAMFNSSTQMCGFTNEENMLRLRRCLKGKALDAVRCALLHPSNVSDILSTLKMLYGRSDAIVQSIVKRIRSLPTPNVEKLETVVNFALMVKNLVATVRACEIDDFIFNASLRYELVDRLPSSLKLDWARFARSIPTPNLADFSMWLYTVAEDASAVMASPCHDQRNRISKKDGFLNFHSESDSGDAKPPESSSKPKLGVTKDRANDQCVVCRNNCSTVARCSRFEGFSYDSKWATVKECKLCRKCLRKHNGSCKQQNECGVNGCTYLHHPLLHNPEIQHIDPSTSKPTALPSGQKRPEPSCNLHQGQSAVLFRIVPVILYGPEKKVETYAFIDDGSELTLMEQSLADELGIEGPRKPLCLKWTGGTRKEEHQSQQVNLKISGARSLMKYELSGISTISSLQIRPQTMLISELQGKYPHLSGLPLKEYRNVSPRLLIGLDYANLGHGIKSREGKRNEPIAIKTRLGWTVYGNCTGTGDIGGYLNFHSVQRCDCRRENDDDLHKAMKSYFALDSMGLIKTSQLLSQEDQRAHSLLKSLTHLKNNRYEVGLLWKYDNIRLPDSKAMAFGRWKCLENRMSKDSALAEALEKKITEHVKKGYIRKLTPEELQEQHSRIWYLPIFAVVNPNKPGKFRLVWDAAATVHGISLNSVLLKGPDQLTSLLSVLIRFREFRVAVCGDIKEMFHQVRMRDEDQHCHRFVWKNSNDTEPSIYVVQVMTFGACCSPSTAQYVKNSNAKQFVKDQPEAVHAIIKQHYVDDMLVSTETEEDAVRLAQNVKIIHERAGFEIHNWISNSNLVTAMLNEETTEEKDLNIGDESSTEKVLGMWWNTSTDSFTYKVSSRYDEALLSGSRRPTKREVLRVLMMIYDPLGLIAHLLMFLKILLQEIWRTPVNWDDHIEDAQFEKWLTWLAVFPKMGSVEVPRCYRTLTSIRAEVEMHTFVDASESGFAAVVYLRFREEHVSECALVGAKTRVAPLKFLSIPKSELQAALLGVRLADTILASVSIKISKRYFWTDSKDVLSWLRSDHRRYSQFVAFRVSEILESTDITEWRYIPTKLNVADEGTKWTRSPDLSASSRWFRGPELLRQSEHVWPEFPSLGKSTIAELRPHLLHHTATMDSVIKTEACSKWVRLLRRAAFIFRYVNNLLRSSRRERRFTGPLTQEELAKAENYLFRQAQSETYADEIAMLAMSCPTKRTQTKIVRNNPLFRSAFLDENGVARVRGRTKACAFVGRDATEPIILPRNHHVTRLIIADIHERFNHQNHATILNEVLQRYRIPRLKATYHAIRRSCQQCKNDLAKPQPPAMADLPQSRLAAFSRPFTYTGVDYFGPIQVLVGRHSEKRWGVLATCLTTRAIHLQIAHTLSTDSCVMAIRNIMARRGVPAVIYSDRGTNFQATSKVLKAAIQQLDHDRLASEFTSSHTQWTFIPPVSPHMGGAWERLIRSVKLNLAKLQPSRLPTDEVLQNALIEVENIVNSRPLTEIPVEDDESPVLTPNHFLLGSANGLRPWVPFDDSPVHRRNSWTQSQKMADSFWKQWVRDYLPTITRRTKWFTPTKPIEVGDVVVVVDPKLGRNYWPKGRIIATQQAPDGQVRRATIQTASGGIYERPTVSLAVLDVGVVANTHSDDPSRIPGGSVDYAPSLTTSTSVD